MRTRIGIGMLGLMLIAAACSRDVEPSPNTEVERHAHEAASEGLTLLAIMQKLGTEMTALTYGLMTDSAELVAKSATAIAEHATISDVQRVQDALGEEFSEFERLDIEVHEASVGLQQAVTSGSLADAMTKLHEVQRGCMGCHTRFRERLRT